MHVRQSGGAKVQKSTKVMTNSHAVAREVNLRCDKTHQHAAMRKGNCSQDELSQEAKRAICRGIVREKMKRKQHIEVIAKMGLNSLRQVLPDIEEFHEKGEAEQARRLSDQIAWDDLTGMELDGGKVIEARAKEIAYARDKEVWKRVTRQEANRKGWKIIGTRWIDINKGDDERPVYRSRLVGKEYNTGDMDGIFAGTPPVEALR